MNILVFRINENFKPSQTKQIVDNITDQIERTGIVFIGPNVEAYVAQDVHGTLFDSPYKQTTEKIKVERLKEFIDGYVSYKPEE